MASEDDFECTQVLHDSFERSLDEVTTEKLQVATFSINGAQLPIYNGDTTIGRDPIKCTIAFDRKSVSSHHALIEIESGHHLICDLGSSNSTRLNGMLLKPHVRYNLTNGASVQIADLKGTYHILPVKKPELDTSEQDIFESPSCVKFKTPKQVCLNESNDNSIIESTPLKREFKLPFPKSSVSSLNDSAHLQNTICESDVYGAETQIGLALEDDSINSSVILSETLEESLLNPEKVDSSLVIPCTQDQLSESSLRLNYDADSSLDASTSEADAKKSVQQHKSDEVDQADNAEKSTEADPIRSINSQPEYEDFDCDDLVKHVEKIERSFSSETMEAPKCEEKTNLPTSNLPTAQNHEEPESSDDIHNAETQLPTCQDRSEQQDNSTNMNALEDQNIIHDAKTQVVSNNCDSDTNEEGVYGASTERPGNLATVIDVKDSEDIHEAKTQFVHANATDPDSEANEEGVYGACTERVHDVALSNSPEKNGSEDVHDAKTQIGNGNCSDSETDEEGMYGACTERVPNVTSSNSPEKKDIHDAKTQIVDRNNSDSDTDEEGMYGASTERPGNLVTVTDERDSEDVHEAKTQFVHANATDPDSEANEEGVYGACTERVPDVALSNSPEKNGSEDVHDAKTQIGNGNCSDSETDEEGMYGACTERVPNVTSSNSPEKKDIHDAKTQIVDRNNSDSDTDEEGMYGASTERPGNLVTVTDERDSEDVHEAKTQFVHANATDPDSEANEEGVHSACTEIVPIVASLNSPGKEDSEDIHDARTQFVHGNADPDSEIIGEGVPCAERAPNVALSNSPEKSGSEDVHDAKTQIVDGNCSDSETDEEEMYGACTERVPNITSSNSPKKKDIHDAKTQNVDRTISESDTDDEGLYGACTERVPHVASTKSPEKKDIHDAKTQIVDGNISDSDTDEEGVYGASTKRVTNVNPCKSPVKKDIHDAKTQIVDGHISDSDTDDERVYGACTERVPNVNPSKSPVKKDIHDAKTQIVDGNISDADTDDEVVYGACTERVPNVNPSVSPEKKDIHDAKTQIVDGNGSDSETDEEGVYGACTERVPDVALPNSPQELRSEGIHDAKTQMVSTHTVSVTNIDDQNGNQDVGNIHSASTQVARVGGLNNETENSGLNHAPAGSLHDAETQILPEPLSTSGCVKSSATENAAKLLIPARTSPRKRLSLSYRKKIDCTKYESKRSSLSPSLQTRDLMGAGHVNDENIFSAATQLLASPSHAQKVEDDLFSAATQKLESPEFTRRSKGHTTHETVGEPCGDPLSTPDRGAKISTPHSTATKNLDHDLFDAATQILPCPSPNVEISDKRPSEDIFSAATQVLPSPVSSRKTRGQNLTDVVSSPISRQRRPISSLNLSHEEDFFCAPTQVLPSPAPSRTRGKNSYQENPLEVSPSPSSTKRSPGKHFSEEDDLCSAATQILPSPISSKITKNQELSPEKVSPSLSPTRRSSVENLSQDKGLASASPQILPSPGSSRRTRGQTSSQENVNISAPTSDLPTSQDGKTLSAASEILPRPRTSLRSRGQNSSQDQGTAKQKMSTGSPKMEGSNKNLKRDFVALETGEADLASAKPSTSRRSVSFADDIQSMSKSKSTTKIAGIEKLPAPPAQTRNKRSTTKPKPLSSKSQGSKKKGQLESQDVGSSQESISDVIGRRPTRGRKQRTISESSDGSCVSESDGRGSSLTKKKETEEKVKEEKQDPAPKKIPAETNSNVPVVNTRRSSRTRNQTAALQDYDCSGESQEPSSKDEVSAASSTASTRGRKSTRNSRQSCDVKPVKGVKSLPSDISEQEELSSKLPKQSNLSLILESSALDESAGPSTLKPPAQTRTRSSTTKPLRSEPQGNKKKGQLRSQEVSSSQESISDVIGRRPTRGRRQHTISESSDGSCVSESHGRGRRLSNKKETEEKVKEEKQDPAPKKIPAETNSNVPVVNTRRSSRTRNQTAALQDYDCSGESQEPSSKDEVSAASSTASTRGRKSTRNSRQSCDVKPVKGVKRLSSDISEHEAVSPKLPKQSNLSLILESSVLDESAGPSTLKRANSLNDSISSEAGPESKRRRGRLDSVVSTSTSPRRSPRQSFRGPTTSSTMGVLFSVYNNPRHESLVTQLGGSVVNSTDSADVLVTDKLRRTVKLLTTLGKGHPIVSPTWLFSSKQAGRLLDPWEYILSDIENETKFNMKLVEALRKAAANPILQGYNILITKSVKPPPEEMKEIILGCGGQCLSRAPSVWPNNAIVVSCEEDRNIWSKLKGKVLVVSAEWLLSGVMRQELENEKFLLKRD